MTPRTLSPIRARLSCAALALALAGCATPPAPQAPASSEVRPAAFGGLAKLDYSGSQEPLVLLQGAVSDAGQDPSKLAALEASLEAILEQPGCTYAGRQAACENLGRLYAISFARGGHPIPPVLVTMLSDSTQVDLARSALERAPGSSVDAVFLAGLTQAEGRVRVSLVQSLGNRRVAQAVPALSSLLNEPDAAASVAAARALGQIASPEAADALAKAADPTSPAVVEARIACAARLGTAEARAALEEMSGNASVPRPLRTAAFASLLVLDKSGAPDRVASALSGSDTSLRQSAGTWLVAVEPARLLPVVEAHFRSWDPSVQEAVVSALGRIGDPAAVPLVLESARSDVPGLRTAALSSLGSLEGSPEVVQLLAGAARGRGEDGAAAKLSLSRLRGPGVDEAVMKGARDPGNPLRTVFLEQLALRDAPGAADLFMAMRAEPEVTLRTAALDGLVLVCTPELEVPLLGWMVAATDRSEQTHALRAAAAAAFRNPDQKARLKPIADLMAGATPAVTKHLLTTLSHVGGAEGALYVQSYVLDAHGSESIAAIEALGHWSDKTGLAPLATIAEKAQDPALRTAAIENGITALPQNPWELTKDDKAVIARLHAATADAGLRGRLDALENPPKK